MRSVAGGGRGVELEPERLAGWFEGFGGRHGGVLRTVLCSDTVEVHAMDGASASVAVPFGGLDVTLGERPGLDVSALLAHLQRPRRVGLVLVRLGGFSVGVAERGRVVVARTGTRPVHGRNRAGGSSAQRFARRRENQARAAVAAAADAVAHVLAPLADSLDAVVLGGDPAALAGLRADPRLRGLLGRAEAGVLDVPQPRRAVLEAAARRVCGVEVVVREPADQRDGPGPGRR